MRQLESCVGCDGLVPAGRAACPHCGQTVRRRGARVARRLASAVGGGALLLTLMACYGGPPKCEPGTDEDHDRACARGVGPLDCNDRDPTIRPLAGDPAGDEIDQNCDGVDGIKPGTPPPPP